MISPCDICKNRQKRLDPYGCSKEICTTGFFGRLLKKIFGCRLFVELGHWRVVANRNQ